MSETVEQFAGNLSSIAQGRAPAGTKFSLKRIRQAGTPLLREEIISIELGEKQRYTSLRSFFDAGGWPIGIWEGPADERTVRALASALIEARVWALKSTPAVSGGDVNTWECSVENQNISLSVTAGSSILMTMSPVDVLLRRIANDLINSHSGAALNCQLFIESAGTTALVRVALVNEGNNDFQIQNPFTTSDTKINFLRIEIGAAPVEVPGVTGSDIAYKPLILPSIGKPPAPWDQDCLVLKAGEKIFCPFQLRIDLSTQRGHFVRAIYSHYGNIPVYQDLPLVRGRVFSKETQLR